MSQPAVVQHYLTLWGHYNQFGEEAQFARDLTRCLMQGIVYKDHNGFAFAEFIEPGHLFIYGWAGTGTLLRFVDQYVASGGPAIERVSWIRTKDGQRRASGPYNFNRIHKVIECLPQ